MSELSDEDIKAIDYYCNGDDGIYEAVQNCVSRWLEANGFDPEKVEVATDYIVICSKPEEED